MKQQLRMEIKEISAEGKFSGILSTYNNLDMGGDVIEPGAFTKTIQEHGNQVPMLWQHKSDEPIGTLTLIDTPTSLNVDGQLLMDLPEAQKAYLLIKARIVRGLSIGFNAVKDAMEGKVRRLKEIRLWEGSIVTFPMDPKALITSVKARQEQKEDFTTEFAEQQLIDAAYQMFIALRYALCSIPWASGMSRDEKIAASAASLQQFIDAYMAYIPSYLDWLSEEYGNLANWSRSEPLETKAGKTISAATKKSLSQAREHMANSAKCMKSADDLLCALTEDEADDDVTSESKAALKSEPDLHSAAQFLTDLRALIPAA